VFISVHSVSCVLLVLIATGNDNLFELTRKKQYKLRVDMADWDGNSRYAEYSNFKTGPSSDKYRLQSLGTYSGNAGTYLYVAKIVA